MEPRMFYGDMMESIPVQVRSVKNVKRKTMFTNDCVLTIPFIMNCNLK